MEPETLLRLRPMREWLEELRKVADTLAVWPSEEARDQWLGRWLLCEQAALGDEMPLDVLDTGVAEDFETVVSELRAMRGAARAAVRDFRRAAPHGG